MFHFYFVGTCRHLSSWIADQEFILARFFSHYFFGVVILRYFLTPFLLELAFECMMYHAYKCIPYLVQSLCIHWMNIVHPIILPVHDRTSNLGFCIFSKCGAFTCPSYRVSLPHILVNISMSWFLRPILL